MDAIWEVNLYSSVIYDCFGFISVDWMNGFLCTAAFWLSLMWTAQ